ncbi:hypothetical protein JCM11641_006783 [Rhodosporidiobolus odoratus]
MPRTSRRRASLSSSMSDHSSDDDLSSLFSSSEEETEKPHSRRSNRSAASSNPSKKKKSVVYRSLPAQGGTDQPDERDEPQDPPTKTAGPGGASKGKPGSRANAQQSGSRKTCLIITAVVVVAVLVVGGGAAYFFRDDLKNLVGGSSSEADTAEPSSSGGTSDSPSSAAGGASSAAVHSSGSTSNSTDASGSAAASKTSGAMASGSGSASASASSASSTSGGGSNSVSSSQTYSLQADCTGKNFFSCFTFNTEKGISADVAQTNSLISVNGSAAYMRLNSWADSADGSRPSLFMEMKDNAFRQGLVIADVGKIPWGCGTWSSIFSYGADWPKGGGIDTLEGISLMEQATPTVVTSDDGCKIGDSSSMSGSILDGHDDCSSDKTVNGYAGCSVENPSKASYGLAWNQAGGGILATLLDDTGVYMWQIARADADVVDMDKPDPSKWGLPVAAWPSTSCSTDYFTEQTLAITLGVCGSRPEATWDDTCSDVADSCAEYVKTGANIANAVWEFNSLRLYSVKAGKGSASEGGAATSAVSTGAAGAGEGEEEGMMTIMSDATASGTRPQATKM